MRFAARSDVGMVRAKNDDSAYVGRYLAVVADGMGGHAGGNVASASTVLDLVHLDRKDYDGDAANQLADEIQTANSLLSELVSANPQLAGMGTTVTALLLNGDRIEFAHIGDSRAYRLKDDVFEQISVDHTFVQRLIDEGRLKPEEADVHPHKNVLMRVLGDVDASPELDLHSFEVTAGERWLLCSDGLNAVLGDPLIARIMRETPDLRACVDTLIDLTLAGGSPDNVTIAVVEIVEATPEDLRTAALTTIPPAKTAAGEKDDAEPPEAAPGSAIRANVIRQDLSSRPHVLVGSAALATETGQIPIVTQRTTERRAAMMLTHKAAVDAELFDDDGEPTRGRKRWLVPSFLGLMALILVAVLWFGYAWTQTRYYVAAYDDNVAIFNGVSQTIGPVKLSHLDQETDIPVSNLPEYQRARVTSSLPATDLEHAQRIVEGLRADLRAVACPPEDATPSPSASPSPSSSSTSDPTADPSSSPSPENSAQAAPGDAQGCRDETS
ncbi:PP2C family protein-serine/threonine phosphatase [Arthrobacter sp. Hz1]